MHNIALLFLLAPAVSAIFFGGGGGGCGCNSCSCPPPPPPCPPPPPPCLPAPCLPQLPPITLPALCLPPLPRISLPCPPPPCGCGRKKRSAPVVSKHFGDKDQNICNNPQIRKIILTNITENPGHSKIAIHSELKAKLHGNYVVMCSTGAFSFVADTHNYCVDGNNVNTCYVFEA